MSAAARGIDRHGVGRGEPELEVVGFFRRRDIELAIEKQIHLMQPCPHHRFTNIEGVLQSVDVTDFVAVKGWNRQLENAEFFQNQLNDNLGVEVKGPAIAFERQLRERVGGIQAVAGVKLRQVRLQHPVLKSGQDLVADPFVVRHPARSRRFLVDHARTEDGIGFVPNQRSKQLRQFFRRILAVAVQEGDDIESVIDGVAITELLVTAVTLVLRRPEHGDLERRTLMLKAQPFDESIVRRRIIDNQHFDRARMQRRRNAVEHFFNRARGVVGNDENEHAFAVKIERRGIHQWGGGHASGAARSRPRGRRRSPSPSLPSAS